MKAVRHFFEWPTLGVAEKKTIKGNPVSPGLVSGRATIITDTENLQRVERGTILVCHKMSPELTIIFPMIKGLVTDEGGVGAYAAIVARTCRLPAVGGTGTATATIHSGDVIRVDGTKGRVEIISRTQ